VAYGTIVTPGLAPYRITSDDRLWAARAAHFEGGHDPADVLWTWTQRYALPNFRRRYGSLRELIQAHSQPVNPIWRRDGSKCRPGAPYHGTDHCAERRLANRDRAARMPFSELRPEVQQKVTAWAKGQLSNPVPTSVDFAAPGVSQSFLGRNPGSQLVKQAGNWFIATAQSRGWAPDHVQIVPSSGLALAVPIVGGVAIAAAAGFAFWAWWRYGRR
jgi:hypothetical protein